MQTHLVCCAAPLLLLAGSPVSARQIDDFETQLESRVLALMESAHLPGVSVGIVHGDSLIFAKGFGVANRATGEPVTPETMFQIGSTTKSFTTTLLGMLLERGTLSLDDSITKHLPPDVSVPASADRTPITVRHLASHTSGLPRQPPTLRRAHGDYPVLAFTHFELYQSLAGATLSFPVGSRFDYSNFGFAVLGHVLERVTGLPYEVLVMREIFQPLGMRSSTVTIWPRFEKRLARPYYYNDQTGQLEDYTPWDLEAMSPAGGISSSVFDLAKYLAFQFSATGNVKAMRDGVTRLSATQEYGMGWIISEADGIGTTIGHGGEVDGYTSYLEFAPEHDVGVIILANAGDGPLGTVGEWIWQRVARDEGPRSP